jgi:hypothetical protein
MVTNNIYDYYQPRRLLKPVSVTQIPAVNLSGAFSGLKNLGSKGISIGIDNLEGLKNLARQSNQSLRNLLPDVGKLTSGDLETGMQLADLLYNRGAGELEGKLARDIQSFREDAMKRGMGASSSFMSGIENLFGANAGALSNLRNDSWLQGYNYAKDVAGMRNDAASILNKLAGDAYYQSSVFPLESGLKAAFNQADLNDSSKKLNLQRLKDYYNLVNSITANTSLNNNLTSFYGEETTGSPDIRRLNQIKSLIDLVDTNLKVNNAYHRDNILSNLLQKSLKIEF